MLTPTVTLLLPHHHLFILLGSGEEGHGLAEAEAALCTGAMLPPGALNTTHNQVHNQVHTQKHKCIYNHALAAKCK